MLAAVDASNDSRFGPFCHFEVRTVGFLSKVTQASKTGEPLHYPFLSETSAFYAPNREYHDDGEEWGKDERVT